MLLVITETLCLLHVQQKMQIPSLIVAIILTPCHVLLAGVTVFQILLYVRMVLALETLTDAPGLHHVLHAPKLSKQEYSRNIIRIRNRNLFK